MLFSPEERERSITLWKSYIQPTLGTRECNRFVQATTKPSNRLMDEIIKPRLFLPQDQGGLYYPVDMTAFSEGRNHELAEQIAGEPDPAQEFGGDPFCALTYFANPLRLDTPTWDDLRQRYVAIPPKDRVVLGRHQVFTFEFDVPTLDFLKIQLSWLRSSGGWRDSPMGHLFTYCSRFADFAGITVNYSGNKSLHIHVVFETELARHKLDLGPGSFVREGLVKHWERLHPEVIRILALPEGVVADGHLKYPESFRRLPNGARLIDKPGHILGFPAGTYVPQITLWEQHRERAAGDDLPLFFHPEPFCAPAVMTKAPRATNPTIRFGQNLTPEERTYCEDQLRASYPGWPRFDHLSYEGERWVAKFRNSPADVTPSSMMREDYATIHLVGRDAMGLNAKPLKFPLGTMLRFWAGKVRAKANGIDPPSIAEVVLEPLPHRVPTPLEDEFRQNVVDAASASRAMRSFFRNNVRQHPLLLVVGPEGLGKTSVLMALHHEIIADLEQRGETSRAMYAFADYDAAEKKCADFNRVQGGNGFIGVVLPSFSRAYEDACGAVGATPISTEEAAVMRCPSRWAAIERHQSAVIREMKARHAALWVTIGDRRPVFFTVHQVAHQWLKSGKTRLMAAPSFWDGTPDDPAHKEVCRFETTLGLLVHDEVKVDSIVQMQPEAVCLWVDALMRSDPKVWSASRLDLARALTSYEKWVQSHGWPKFGERDWPLSFDEVVRVSYTSLPHWDHVETADTGEYVQKTANDVEPDEPEGDHRDIYATRHDRSWMIASQDWWRGVAKNVVVLTTEAVPTAVLLRADPSWSVFELETPLVPRDFVETYPTRSVTGSNLPTICSDWRNSHPADDFFIVSNKVSALTETMTHVGARGSNELIGRNVLSTMTFMTPDEYERLQALNAWTGRSDLVGLRHIDEFNQSAGRNLGYRKRGDVKHVLLVNRRLFGVLMGGGEPLRRSRYDFRLHLDRHQRYEIKRAG
jgi:hypothetical protein